jgi:phospholipid/cholesterol/gamma-HCH transport system ATP-binding protein
VAEWSNAPDSKSGVRFQRTVGSNPTLSAKRQPVSLGTAGHPAPAFMAPNSTPAIVELRHLTFGYGERVILHDVSLSIPHGKVTALIGPMGAGKTTTLRLIGGQIRPQSGEVLFEDQDLARMDQTQLYAMRRRMGMLFQFGALFADISVLENVAFPLREHTSLPEAMVRDIVLMKLHAVGLRGARDLMPSDLSGGMTRRVALARAIAMDPDLVIYDEPFSGLDPISLHTVAQLIRQLNDSLSLTSIFVSHEIEQTFEIADHVIVMADGKVVSEGSPDEMRNSTDPMVHQYVNSLPDGPVGFHYTRVPIEEDLGMAALARARRE